MSQKRFCASLDLVSGVFASGSRLHHRFAKGCGEAVLALWFRTCGQH